MSDRDPMRGSREPVWMDVNRSGDNRQCLASGQNTDAAEVSERKQIAVARDDEVRLGGECTGEHAIIVGISADRRDGRCTNNGNQCAVAKNEFVGRACYACNAGRELFAPKDNFKLRDQRRAGK